MHKHTPAYTLLLSPSMYSFTDYTLKFNTSMLEIDASILIAMDWLHGNSETLWSVKAGKTQVDLITVMTDHFSVTEYSLISVQIIISIIKNNLSPV